MLNILHKTAYKIVAGGTGFNKTQKTLVWMGDFGIARNNCDKI